MQDKDKAIVELTRKLTASDQTVAERDGQIEIVKSKLAHAESRLAEAERTMESNQQVISWLNKEVNEAQMSTRGAFNPAMFRPALPSSVSSMSGTGLKHGMTGPNPEVLLASARYALCSCSASARLADSAGTGHGATRP